MVQTRSIPLAIVATVLALVAALAALAAAPRSTPAPPVALTPASRLSIDHFMTGLACIESSGRYSALNPDSGAIGKYQIMPRNWRVWARRFLGDAQAEPTPQNQELVARRRIQRLHENLGEWRRVAYWWLTGRSSAEESLWTDKARGYVERVMEVAQRAGTPALASGVPERCRPAPAARPTLRPGAARA